MSSSQTPTDEIRIRGARENNLKNINLAIPREKLTVITGVSGSGKSSLAFDTLFAEGFRRFAESLSAYARQFLELGKKPEVDAIEGLSPAIAIDQKTTSRNPRSTVGTITEIHDFLRLLFSKIGKAVCPRCEKAIDSRTLPQIADAIEKDFSGKRVMILAPLIRQQKGEHREVFARLRKEGFVRARVDGEVFPLTEIPALDAKKKHSIEVVVDRLEILKEEGD